MPLSTYSNAAVTPKILGPGGPKLGGGSDEELARRIRFGNSPNDYAVYNVAKQMYESAKTGQPWHGQVVGGYAIHGKFSNNPSPDMPGAPGANPVQFTVTKTVKQPEVAAATNAAIGAQNQVSQANLTGFKDFLNQAREINAQGRDQLAKDQAAFDTSGIERTLPAINSAYRTDQNAVTQGIRDRNADFASETQSILDRLSAENRTYEANAQAVADRAYAGAVKANKLYQLGSGTPRSGSGNLSNRYIKAYQDINIPLQRELADRRYSQLINIERPFDERLYGNDISLLNRESGLASDFAGRDEATAKYLQGLRMQVAGMSRQQAQQYLASLGIPLELGNRIMSGEIANLSGLAALDNAVNYYTVQTPFDASRVPDTFSYPVSYPARTYTAGAGFPSSAPVTAAPITGTNRDGTPRTNPLAPDYSSWYTPALQLLRNKNPSYVKPVKVPLERYIDNPVGGFDASAYA